MRFFSSAYIKELLLLFKITAEKEKELIQLRRRLHMNPELGFSEYETSNLIAEYLEKSGVEVTRGVAKTGVVGLIRGKGDGKTLLLRADIDALPMQETAECEYASLRNGAMHACGHDVHTAVLLGAAGILSETRGNFPGNIKLVFQPAEESIGGALPMIEAGVMENPRVDGAAAFHISELPLGSIGIKKGCVTASPDHFHIRITGRGGHGASPESCVNPVEIGSRIATRLNNIRLDMPSVVSICAFQSGTGENIIPDTALLMGTARALDKATRQRLYEMILSISDEVATSLGGKAEVDYRFLYPPGENDADMTDMFIKAAEAVIGRENIIYQEKSQMVGDDFSYFAERVPSCYVQLGGAIRPLHSSDFDVDERCISIGAEIMSHFALKFLGSI
ncbi:MAG: putative hydrolase YxeP [Firmicutes bacterium ADurb.Bin193]|nr:MAG: putative hydrolase YxeP [Firmicutes bacterium ADurb.Bin193]